MKKILTLENVQVDCRDLTREQIKEISKIIENKGYNYNNSAYFQDEDWRYVAIVDCYIEEETTFYFNYINQPQKTTINYEKFMKLFGNKEKSEEFNNLVEVLNEELTEEAYKETEYEVKYIAEKPNQYNIGIDTFNPQPHYNNENGSLYKIANNLGLNHWEFDIFKRLVRCRKKNQFKEDLQKIKDTIDIYLNEYSE